MIVLAIIAQIALIGSNIGLFIILQSGMDWVIMVQRAFLICLGVFFILNEVFTAMPWYLSRIWTRFFFTTTFFVPRGLLFIFVGFVSLGDSSYSGATTSTINIVTALRWTSAAPVAIVGAIYLILGLICIDSLDIIVKVKMIREKRKVQSGLCANIHPSIHPSIALLPFPFFFFPQIAERNKEKAAAGDKTSNKSAIKEFFDERLGATSSV